MKKILIIGGGSIGKRHLRNLLSLGEKNLTVVETNPDRRGDIEKEFSVKTASSLEDAYKSNNYDIAFVCSPSRFHTEQAIFCVENDSDVFVEKPLSHNLDNVDKLIELVESKKVISMVGSNWKYYPLFKKMKEVLDSNVLGKILSARCQFGQYLPDWHPWEDHKQGYSANKKLGGGVLLDSHEFDYLTWFLGKVNQVACMADRVGQVTVDTEDVAEVLLKFENGAIGEIHLDYLQRFYQRNFEFFGENGTMIWDTNKKSIVLKIKDEDEKIFALPENYDLNDMYISQTKEFLQCVENRKETQTPVRKGAEVLKLICAAKESSESNKFVNL